MSALSREIQRQIQSSGPMTFAQFMDTALYTPELGYYEQPGKIGFAGDYFTSVSTGPLFGQLLAFQFAEWLDKELPEGKIQVVEAGANDGRLAQDILEWFGHRRPDLIGRLDYFIVESSNKRREWQATKLDSWKANVKWTQKIGDFTNCQINGVVFSNEFFDALPVHRLAWNAEDLRWQEWYVVAERDGFAWHLDEPCADLAARLPLVPAELARVLPSGFIVEISSDAIDWWSAAAKALHRGKLLTIDYGFNAETWLRLDRPNGTLRAFCRHSASSDLLANPGQQDLTADVNFSALEAAGQAAGLGAANLIRQEKFLAQLIAKIHANRESFGTWDQESARQFQTLAHPEHLGRSFQVLIQY